MRVVSLVPSSTETLLAMGADVVACTKYCEQPALLHVGGTKNPDIEAIVALRPDLVVVDREENRLEDAEALRDAGLQLFVSDVTSVDDALAVVEQLAMSVGRTMDMSPPGIRASALEVTVFVPIWRRPWMSIGAATYGGSVLASLGCRLVTADDDAPYPQIDLGDLRALAPDAVLVPSEPYDFTDAHLDELRTAVPDAALLRVDGQDLFWWGIRTPAAIERLRNTLMTGGVPLPTG